MLEAMIKDLSRELELSEELVVAPGSSCTIPLEDNLSIEVMPQENGCVFRTTLGPCPQTNKEQFIIQLLHANLFGQGTQGACLGLTADGNQIILSRQVNYVGGYRTFRDAFEDFINSIDFWREEALLQQKI